MYKYLLFDCFAIVLFSSGLTIQCMQIGNNLFQIHDPFDNVRNAVKVGDKNSFAVTLQSGVSGAARFSLTGSTNPIKRAL